MSLTDQQRTETAADNCEVLRARLARYEDGEGRPVGLTHDQAELVRLVRDLALRAGKHARPLIHAAALGLESQAREIERLNSDYNEACEDAMCVARELERQKMNCLNLLQQLEDLKAQHEQDAQTIKVLQAMARQLKAQPSVVVPAALIEALKYYANGDHLLLADPDAWDTCSGEPINFLHDDAGTASVEDGSIAKAALDSLNSSPVSAGDDRETIRAVFLRNGFTIKEGQADLKPYVYAAADELMSIARAALSAPSHGEQVRGLPECVRAWFEAKKAHVKAVGDYNARLAFVKQHMPFGTSVDPEYQIMEAADRKVRDLVWPMFVGLMEIAAPSAGSQEQGE